ncbi:MAG: DUF3325 domain-containing protein [Paucibacter sp.]|nr:DUF3325 domain-containing protein [Roseateles sp.]
MTMLHQLLCCQVAFTALCLAMDRHHEDAMERPLEPCRRRWLRALALLAFALSWVTVWPRTDVGIAWVEWVAQLTLAAVSVVALTTWRPRWMARIATVSATAALLLPTLTLFPSTG